LKFDFAFGGPRGISPFGNTPGPGRFSQHKMATADVIDTAIVGAASGVPTWQSGAGAIYTLFSAFPCDSGAANQPPMFVTSPSSVDHSVATEALCYVGEACEIALHARDFEMDSLGVENNVQSADVVRIELATGVATHVDTDLKHVNGSVCQGDGAVSCILNLTNSGENTEKNASWIGRTEVRCLVAVDVHSATAAPARRTCRSMPLCIKVHFVPLSSSDGHIAELGDPLAQVLVNLLPYVENELQVSWKHLGFRRAASLGNVTLEYVGQNASVPHTLAVEIMKSQFATQSTVIRFEWRAAALALPRAFMNIALTFENVYQGLSWNYASLEARVPLSVLRATIPRNFVVAGTLMRFRVVVATKSAEGAVSASSFSGPWSEWLKLYAAPPRVHSSVVYATSWESNSIHLWRLQRQPPSSQR